MSSTSQKSMKVEAADCSMVEHGLILINSSQHTLEVKKIQRNKQFSAQDAWYGFWSKLEIGHCRRILYCLSYQGRPWIGYPIPSPGDLPDPGIKLGSPALQAGSLPAELPGKPIYIRMLLNFPFKLASSSRVAQDSEGKWLPHWWHVSDIQEVLSCFKETVLEQHLIKSNIKTGIF